MNGGGFRNGTIPCGNSNIGAIRYNSANPGIEFCNGTAWKTFVQSASNGVIIIGDGLANCKTATTGAIRYDSACQSIDVCNGTAWTGVGTTCTSSSDTAFVTGESLSSPRNDWSGDMGFQLVVGASDITVTQLGRWVISGNNQSHTLRIFNSGCSSIASVAVNTSGAPAAAFVYGTLGSPVTLSAGGTYYIMSSEVSGFDSVYDTGGVTLTTTSVASIQTAVYSPPGCSTYGAGANHAYGPVDFKYHF